MKHGFAFGEHIKTEKIKRRRYYDAPPSRRLRGFLFPIILIMCSLLLLWKLFFLQIIHGTEYRKLADSNRIRSQVIHAPRGIIFDRNGLPLVVNMPGFRQIEKPQNATPSSPDKIGVQSGSKKATESKTTLLSREQALKLIAAGSRNVEVDSHRQYPLKDATSHILGYIGQISKEELTDNEFSNYQANDWIGKSGIERKYEHTLRGVDGKQLIEVDALGKKVRSLGVTDPIPGRDVTLTVDSKLQEASFNALSDIKKGAIIVSRPNGEILTLISKPSFDPNLFTLDDTYKSSTTSGYTSLQAVLQDNDNQPLLNRAISGVYPPGSTFKIVTAASGLENKIIDENYHITDTGVIKVGEFSFANWYYTDYGRTEQGEINVVRALARSNDIFFYRLAEKVTVDKLSAMGKKFGLGQTLGIDLDGESSGTVPTRKWKEEHIKEGWYLGDTYHYGIGQGFLLTTPLQVNTWTQVISNGGSLYEPHLLKPQNPKPKTQNVLTDKTVSLIRQGMIQSCSTGGVAWPLFDFKVKNPKLKIDGKNFLPVASASADFRKVTVACKTGTAQHGGEHTLPHAWITLFAPAYKPEVVVTVLAESSGEGSNFAAPIAKKVLEAYFGK